MKRVIAFIIAFILLVLTSVCNAGGIDLINRAVSNRGTVNVSTNNPLILKALRKDEKQEIKILKTKEEVKEVKKEETKDVLLGLDISKWNGEIDWKAVKDKNISFVIIRAGYGNTVDYRFEQNIKGAIDNDMLIGVYWFSYSYTNQGAHLEAKKCYNTIKKYKKHIVLPVFWDFEYDSVNYAKKHGHSISKERASNMADTFCTTIKGYGMETGIYTNLDYSKRYFTKEVLSKYHTWIACWASECTYKEHYIIWQCSDKFYIKNKRYDLNYLYYNRYLKDKAKKKDNKTITVKATAYAGDTSTSTLVKPKVGRTIATDPNVIPYGSRVYIPALGKTFIAEDCGGGIKGKRIDIFMRSERECINWGVREIEIYIIE